MGLRFQKSINLGGGIRLNLSKSGVGVSAGRRGMRVGVDSKGRRYSSVGLPGTGLSMRNYSKGSRRGGTALGIGGLLLALIAWIVSLLR